MCYYVLCVHQSVQGAQVCIWSRTQRWCWYISLFFVFLVLHFDFFLFRLFFFVCFEYVKYRFVMTYRLLECKQFGDWVVRAVRCWGICVVHPTHVCARLCYTYFYLVLDLILVWWFAVAHGQRMWGRRHRLWKEWATATETIVRGKSGQQKIETNGRKKLAFSRVCDDDLCLHRRILERIQRRILAKKSNKSNG